MPDPSSKKKRPRDANQLAKLIVDIATGEIEDVAPPSEKNPHAVALGRLGGLKGGPARAKKLSAMTRRQLAQKAARARWGKQTERSRDES